VPKNCFGTGAAKAAHTGGLRPRTVFKVFESGYTGFKDEVRLWRWGRYVFLSVDICVGSAVIFLPLMIFW
jgi:hypothetical protein